MPEFNTLLKRIFNTGPMMDIARKILVTFAIFAKFAILKAVLFKSFLLKLRKELVSNVLLTLGHSLTKEIFFFFDGWSKVLTLASVKHIKLHWV